MTKQEAIDLLNDRKNKIDAPNFDPVVWTAGTTSILKRIFVHTGETKSHNLNEITYEVLAPMAGPDLQQSHRERGKEQSRNFLLEYINEVNSFGIEKSSESDNKLSKDSDTVGKTLWDVLNRWFTKKPTIVLATLIGVLIIFLFLVLTGLIKFEINEGKVSLSYNPNGETSISTSGNNSSDQLVTFCLSKGTELKKKYVIKSIVQSYDAELIGKNEDTLVVKERIIYDILGLQDITKAEDIFKEGYSSNIAFKVERWFGTDREKLLHMGNESTYYVHFDCKKGESITMMTGANFYYTYPLKDNRDGVFRGYRLASNEDLWIYPNDEDVIGKLTMLWASKDIKLQQISGGAWHTITKGQTKVNDDKDAFYNLVQIPDKLTTPNRSKMTT